MTISREAYLDLVKENDRLREELDAQAATHAEEIKRLTEALAGTRNVSDDKTREIEQAIRENDLLLATNRRLTVESKDHSASILTLQSRLLAMEQVVKVARAASHALRSYQYGNASPDLAEEVANNLDSALAALDALPKETDDDAHAWKRFA